MKGQTVMLALALVAIIGPAAGVVYSKCKLAAILQKHGIAKSDIPNCKYNILLFIYLFMFLFIWSIYLMNERTMVNNELEKT
jgi:hypothetical protein